jgi:hypothetical protein
MSSQTDASAIVRVNGGRGFVVQGERDWLVITAAHCLCKQGRYKLPPADYFSGTEDRTYPRLIGVAKSAKIWAECLFADPVNDIAVMGPVDGQFYGHERVASWDEMMEAVSPLAIADAATEGVVQLYALDGERFRARIQRREGEYSLWIRECEQPITSGMSGSPICNGSGKAIGVVSISIGPANQDDHHEGHAGMLTRILPVWLVRELKHPVMACPRCGLDGMHLKAEACVRALHERAERLEAQVRTKTTTP